MKEQNTYVEYSRSEIDTQSDETKWNRFDALTDADIDTAAASDEDDPKTDATFWEDATVVMPENIVAIDLDLLDVVIRHSSLDYETQIKNSPSGICLRLKRRQLANLLSRGMMRKKEGS